MDLGAFQLKKPAPSTHPTEHVCPVLCSQDHLHRHVAPLSWLLNTRSLRYSLYPSRASISSRPKHPLSFSKPD
jgi:hypothetical protein